MGACRGCRRELDSERRRKWEGALRTLSLFGIVHDMSGAHVSRAVCLSYTFPDWDRCAHYIKAMKGGYQFIDYC